MDSYNQNHIHAKINHYQEFIKRRNLNNDPPRHLQYIKLSVKEPQYIYKHHDQAYLRLGVPDHADTIRNHEIGSPLAVFNNSIISRSFYILMTLVLLLIVSAVVAFVVREFLLFKKDKVDSAMSSELKLAQWPSSGHNHKVQKIPSDRDDLLSLEKVIQSVVPPALLKDESGLTKFADDTTSSGNRQWGLQQKYNLTSAALSLDATGSERRENDHISGFSDKSISKYAKNLSPLASSFHDGKIRYTIADLHNLNTNKLNSEAIRKSPEGVTRIPISKLVKCPVSIPEVRFDHSWEASKALMEISKTLNESELKTEKILAAFKLVSIAKQSEFFENPNIFMSNFNICVEDLVHTCILFDLWSYCSATLSVLLLECMLIYCWSHARYHIQSPAKLRMEQSFTKWNGRQPSVQSQMCILHILFNIFLGFKVVDLPEDITKENELKLGLVIRELIKKSACNDYNQILPMIARASEAASNGRSKLFFYEMTKLLVSNHKNCCIDVYLKDSNFELKALLKKGLLSPESDPIHKRSKEILGIILECGKEAEIWQLEVLNSECPTPSILPLSSEYTERLFVQEKRS
ncbi:hypothetical protein I9W82_001592 [Candida metapsilosis]|uniref:Uncharacterized protein n=1 Tax=Candida metapsilosis TaxID=273372 RepID=A0A8H7ZD42_9ASCO|nr:hypothetical protein I9W82_001592 [Candida metapsilosis]